MQRPVSALDNGTPSTVRRRAQGPLVDDAASEISNDSHRHAAITSPSILSEEDGGFGRRGMAMLEEKEPEQRRLLLEDDESSGDENDKMRLVPLLRRKVYIDDHDALYVLVFPRAKDPHRGQVNTSRSRSNPHKCWERIFGRKHEEAPQHERMNEAEFQELVRHQILKILRRLRVKAVATESVDKDEVFLKISVSPDEVATLAHTFHYAMPYKDESYSHVPRSGAYPGGHPMKNEMNDHVVAYEEFSPGKATYLEPFRQVDAVRLLAMQLSSEMHMSELVRQNIISRHFPAANYKQVHELNEKWGGLLPNLCTPPGPKELEFIRDYFGEEIAFFFWWFAMYIKFLLALVIAALCVQVLLSVHAIPGHRLTAQNRDQFCSIFGITVVLWQIAFMKTTKSNMARLTQKWGMEKEHMQNLEFTLDSYDPKLEGSMHTKLARLAMMLAVPVYMGIFAFIVTFLDRYAATHTVWGYSLFTTFLVKVMSFGWRRVAFSLACLQNHRTQRRLNNILIVTLSIVKIFAAMFPFIRRAFLMPLEPLKCGATLSDAAYEIYSNGTWPVGVDAEGLNLFNGAPIPDFNLTFLKSSMLLRGHQTCISVCYPIKCVARSDLLDPWMCETTCMHSLTSNLITFYVSHFALTCLYIIFPVVWTTKSISQELEKARDETGKAEDYSFIQFQAKCHQNASYTFASWGGSYVEDFLEVLVGYSVLVCFGLWNPIMTVVGCGALILEYRLLAFRMTNVTCRPFPRCSQGIGVWQDVFEPIGMLGVTCNVLVMVLLLEPIRSKTWPSKLMHFILFEKAIVVTSLVVVYVWPDTPSDVIRIDDFNSHFKRQFNKEMSVLMSKERANYSHIDISLESDDKGDEIGSASAKDMGTESDTSQSDAAWLCC